MIGFLRGILLQKDVHFILIDVNGVGYEVEISLNTFSLLPELNQETALHTHFYVREETSQLYGFSTFTEKQLFRRLIKVSGIGPKVALAILSHISPDAFVSAVLGHDHATLTRLPGIGKKTAERLILEMKDGLSHFDVPSPSLSLNVDLKVMSPLGAKQMIQKETRAALHTLGYKPYEIDRVLLKLNENSYNSSQELLRDSLQSLAQTH